MTRRVKRWWSYGLSGVIWLISISSGVSQPCEGARDCDQGVQSDRVKLEFFINRPETPTGSAGGIRGFGDTERAQLAQQGVKPSVKINIFKIKGKLNRSKFRRRIIHDRRKYKRCYLDALRAQPDLQGAVHIQLTTSAQGEVSAVQVKKSTLNYPELERCVSEKLKELRIQATTDGRGVTAQVALKFKAKKGQ